MRRKEKEITDPKEIDSMIHKSKMCRLGMVDGDLPYIVPMNFGYEAPTVFLHSAKEGRKIEILKKNANVCVEFDTDCSLVENDRACAWGMRYVSVIAFGKARIVDDPLSKRHALDILMRHYSDFSFHYPDEALSGMIIIQVDIDSMTGKRSG